MMRASSLSFLLAVLIALAGLVWGIVMAIAQDHSTMPAHAHLNLLGWVSLFLFGMFYRLHPALDAARIARLQVWSWVIGTIVMIVGVALLHSQRPGGDPLAAAGSVVVLISMLLFARLVFRYERAGKPA